MAKSISSPWLEDTLAELIAADTTIDGFNDNESLGSASNSLKRYQNGLKVVQVISCNPQLRILDVSDGQHLINVFYTAGSACEEIVENVGASQLKYSMIKLKKYHVTTTVTAAGDREQDKVMGKISFPFSILCKDLQYIGGHDLEKLGNPTNINTSPVIKMLIDKQSYRKIVRRLAIRQFHSLYLPQADGEDGAGDESFGEEGWILTREHLFAVKGASTDYTEPSPSSITIIPGSKTKFAHSDISRAYAHYRAQIDNAHTNPQGKRLVAIPETEVAAPIESTQVPSTLIDGTLEEEDEDDDSHQKEARNIAPFGMFSGKTLKMPYSGTLIESTLQEDEDDNEPDLLNGQEIRMLDTQIPTQSEDALLAISATQLSSQSTVGNQKQTTRSQSKKLGGRSKTIILTGGKQQTPPPVPSAQTQQSQTQMPQTETLIPGNSQASPLKSLSGKTVSSISQASSTHVVIAPVSNGNAVSASTQMQTLPASQHQYDPQHGSSPTVSPSSSSIASYQLIASQLEHDFLVATTAMGERLGVFSPPSQVPMPLSTQQIIEQTSANIAEKDSSRTKAPATEQPLAPAVVRTTQQQAVVNHNVDNVETAVVVEEKRDYVGQKISKYSEGIEFHEIKGIVRVYDVEHQLLSLEFETGEIQHNVPVAIASYNFVMDDVDGLTTAGSADWSKPFPPPAWPALTAAAAAVVATSSSRAATTSSSSGGVQTSQKQNKKHSKDQSSQNVDNASAASVVVPFVIPPLPPSQSKEAKDTADQSNVSKSVSKLAEPSSSQQISEGGPAQANAKDIPVRRATRSNANAAATQQQSTTTSSSTTTTTSGEDVEDTDFIMTQPQAKYRPSQTPTSQAAAALATRASAIEEVAQEEVPVTERRGKRRKNRNVDESNSTTSAAAATVVVGAPSVELDESWQMKQQVNALLAEYEEERNEMVHESGLVSDSESTSQTKKTSNKGSLHRFFPRSSNSKTTATNSNARAMATVAEDSEEENEEEEEVEQVTTHVLPKTSMFAKYLGRAKASPTDTKPVNGDAPVTAAAAIGTTLNTAGNLSITKRMMEEGVGHLKVAATSLSGRFLLKAYQLNPAALATTNVTSDEEIEEEEGEGGLEVASSKANEGSSNSGSSSVSTAKQISSSSHVSTASSVPTSSSTKDKKTGGKKRQRQLTLTEMTSTISSTATTEEEEEELVVEVVKKRKHDKNSVSSSAVPTPSSSSKNQAAKRKREREVEEEEVEEEQEKQETNQKPVKKSKVNRNENSENRDDGPKRGTKSSQRNNSVLSAIMRNSKLLGKASKRK